MTKQELLDRGVKLADKYSSDELKEALSNALANDDSEERLVLQYALTIVNKQPPNKGHVYTNEIKQKRSKKLSTEDSPIEENFDMRKHLFGD